MTAQPISINGAGCKSGGCVRKAVELTSGDLPFVRDSELRVRPVRTAVSQGKRATAYLCKLRPMAAMQTDNGCRTCESGGMGEARSPLFEVRPYPRWSGEDPVELVEKQFRARDGSAGEHCYPRGNAVRSWWRRGLH